MPRGPISRVAPPVSLFLLLNLIFVLPASTAAPRLPQLQEQAAAAFSPTVHRLDEAVARGELSYSEAAVQKLYYLFDRSSLDSRYDLEGPRPSRCGTSPR